MTIRESLREAAMADDHALYAAAKKLYEASLDDSIHCNRHPSFEELSEIHRVRWLNKAEAGGPSP